VNCSRTVIPRTETGGVMKIGWLIVAFFVLSAQAYALDFRGIEIGSNVNEAKKIANTITNSEIIYSSNKIKFDTLIKDVSVRVEVISDENLVVQILFDFSRENYSTIKNAMIDKYGSKFSVTSKSYKNDFGITSDYERVSWAIKSDSVLLLEKGRYYENESFANIKSTKWWNKQVEIFKNKNKSKPGF
jgi:hypothetical protein